MCNTRLTEQQIIAILHESAAAVNTAELIRRHGMSLETFYDWRRRYGGLTIDEAKPVNREAASYLVRATRVNARQSAGRIGLSWAGDGRRVTDQRRAFATVASPLAAIEHSPFHSAGEEFQCAENRDRWAGGIRKEARRRVATLCHRRQVPRSVNKHRGTREKVRWTSWIVGVDFRFSGLPVWSSGLNVRT
jgi:Transposase